MKSVFARHGIPDEVIVDNMPFSSKECIQFAQEWGFEINTSSPRYPQSNGMSERTIQTVKNRLKKAEDDGNDPYIALLEYRNTPVSGLQESPAQLLPVHSLAFFIHKPKNTCCLAEGKTFVSQPAMNESVTATA